MKPIVYPLELFSYRPFDAFGNVRLEIRDKDRNFVLYLSIKGRETQESKRFTEELAPKIVKMLNDMSNAMPESTETKEGLNPVASNPEPIANHQEIEKQEETAILAPKKRGRPAGWRKS